MNRIEKNALNLFWLFYFVNIFIKRDNIKDQTQNLNTKRSEPNKNKTNNLKLHPKREKPWKNTPKLEL